MRPYFDAAQEAFRHEVRALLSDFRDLDGFFRQGHQWPRVQTLFRALGERGWLALGWPEVDGGLARGPEWEFILWDEIAYARAARNPLSAGIVARSLIRCGTEAQRAQWLPEIRSGETHFSLAYSEPEAGSDLGGLRCRATAVDGGYRINGQKCWQSYAQDMDCFWLLARTGEPEGRSRGLSLFIVPKDTAGVSVHPLPTLDDDQLNEVFFDDAWVPEDARVGPEGGAWTIMGEALADERHIQFPPGRVRRDLEELVAWLDVRGRLSDPVVRARLGELAVTTAEVEALALRVVDAMVAGRPAVAEAAANKVAHTLACQSLARCVVELGGPEALVVGERPEFLWRQSLWETIGGGTTEIMRSVVAQHALGLSARN